MNTLVLDEANRMLDMGFHEDIMSIIHHTPQQRQMPLFSATLPDGIKNISQMIQRNPVDIQVEILHDNKKIKQTFYEIQKGERLSSLVSLFQYFKPESCVVFSTENSNVMNWPISCGKRVFMPWHYTEI